MHRKKIVFIMLLAELLVIGGCSEPGCSDPAALNYDPNAKVRSSFACKYGRTNYNSGADTNSLYGTWAYIDTFTWYPPAGGDSVTTITPYTVVISDYWYPLVYVAGFENNPNYLATIYGANADTLRGRNDATTFIVSTDRQTITFNDGTNNSAVGYMHRQR